ncbi:transmembrane protein 198-B-like [Neolamprologus brichardi]|nr:transmembrane protein 198-B-like [Neolamprologus brichardi]
MRIRQREERLKKEKENKKKKKRQSQKTGHKQKTHSHHNHQQYHHPTASHPHHQTQSSQPPKVPPPPPQTEPGYHRKANSKRRFDGDVLSPSYIRSFRDRQTDRRAYSHSRMMSRSRMAELDYDCGSQVPLTAPSGPPVRI